MELWIDLESIDNSGNDLESISSLAVYADRIWQGSAPDVAEITLDDYRGQEEAFSMIGLVPWILIRCSNWTMIPLENLIAGASKSGTKIAVFISNKINIGGATFALQHGVDALLLADDEEIWEIAKEFRNEKQDLITPREENESKLSIARITSIESGGFGERVCIDLVERLGKGEGMALGSTANMLCLIHGETLPSEYVPSRPFRVNAGAIHSYVLMKGEKTKYLSELKSGEQVTIIDLEGKERFASIGRIKIERRPFLKIEYLGNEMRGQIIVQQAETVRLMSKAGEAISVTGISIGDEVLVYSDPRMRHISIAIEGDVREI